MTSPAPVADRRGLWLTTFGAEAIELLPTSQLGWVAVDLQHGTLEVSDLVDVLRVCPVPVLARAASQDAGHLARVLDTGAAGVIVPGVDGAADASALVAACRFPPEGRRSSGLSRSAAVGGPARPLLLPMVETWGALEEVEAILDTPGVDGAFVGPYDLSLALGRPGPVAVAEEIARVAAACTAAGLLSGCFSANRDLDALLPDLDLVAVDTDAGLLRAGFQSLLG